MAGEYLNDSDDDFMDIPGRERRGVNDPPKQKNKRNRGSQECLTTLNKNFSDKQKGAAGDMGMQSLMNVRCKNLNNVLCD